MDDVGSGFFSKLFKIELSGGAKCFCSGLGSRWWWWADHIGVEIKGGGFEGVRVDKGDAGIGEQGGVLWGLWNKVVVGARTSRFKEGEARDDKLETELGAGGNSGQPGDNGGRCGTRRVLEMGASRTWVIPSVVGTVASAKVQKVGKGLPRQRWPLPRQSYDYTGRGSTYTRAYKASTTLPPFETFADVRTLLMTSRAAAEFSW